MTGDAQFDLCIVAVFGAVLAIGIVVGFAWGMRIGMRRTMRLNRQGWEPVGEPTTREM